MKWIVTYEDKSGDCSSVWTNASTKSEAIENIKSEYWDVESIIEIRKG